MGPRPQGRGRAPGSRLRPALDGSGRTEPSALTRPESDADAGLRTLFEEAARVPQPSPREQAELLERAGSGDEPARATLLKSKLLLVGRLAAARGGKGLPLRALGPDRSVGSMGA